MESYNPLTWKTTPGVQRWPISLAGGIPLEAHRTILTCVVSPVRLTLPFSGAACATAHAASQKASLSTGSVLVFRPHGRQ